MELTELLEAGAAAERLGVSPSGLRRYASLYEQVHGELPRKVNTENRLYPGEALGRLAGARQLVETGRCKSILEALEALERGVRPDVVNTEGKMQGFGMTGDASRALLEELRALRAELAELRAEVKEVTALPPAARVGGERGGVLTRLAERVERWLGGLRS
jgi:DNA-binding transcriptional MerR regulator